MAQYESHQRQRSASQLETGRENTSHDDRSFTPEPTGSMIENTPTNTEQSIHSSEQIYPTNFHSGERNRESFTSPISTTSVIQLTPQADDAQSLSSSLNIDVSRSQELSDESSPEVTPLRIRHLYSQGRHISIGPNANNADADEILGDLNLDLSSIMDMPIQEIEDLQQSLARELVITQNDLIDVGNSITNSRQNTPTQSERDQERRPSLGARAA